MVLCKDYSTDTFELEARFDSCKSFYGKAIIKQDEKGSHLYSYNVLVASLFESRVEVYNVSTQTTLRHVKEFLLKYGYKAISKKQILEDYYVDTN